MLGRVSLKHLLRLCLVKLDGITGVRPKAARLR